MLLALCVPEINFTEYTRVRVPRGIHRIVQTDPQLYTELEDIYDGRWPGRTPSPPSSRIMAETRLSSTSSRPCRRSSIRCIMHSGTGACWGASRRETPRETTSVCAVSLLHTRVFGPPKLMSGHIHAGAPDTMKGVRLTMPGLAARAPLLHQRMVTVSNHLRGMMRDARSPSRYVGVGDGADKEGEACGQPKKRLRVAYCTAADFGQMGR